MKYLTGPPQSPVAWSNFITGAGPGEHGLFDFIHRDPATYQPVSSATALPTEVASTLDLFGLHIPLSGGEVSNNRGATAFWELLQQDGISLFCLHLIKLFDNVLISLKHLLSLLLIRH